MSSASGKILVIRGGAIGDFILTVPVLTALRDRFPDIGLELLAYPRVGQLALEAGLVDHLEAIDARPMASFFARGGPLPTALGHYFATVAVIFSFLFDPDRIFQENVSRVSKAQFIVGPHRPDEAESVHATEVFLRPLERLAIFDANPVPRLLLPTERGRTSGGDLEPPPKGARWLALHPGSGSERKNWPERNWVQLIAAIFAETNCSVLLVGGEAEGERLERLSRLVPTDRVRLARNRPLPELGRLLSRCWGYVGHDSGISHLAAAVGTRSLVLWGDTRREIWEPRSPGVTVLASPKGLEGLELEEVLSVLRSWD